jgi:hypothetical protein
LFLILLKHLWHFNLLSANNRKIVASGLELKNTCSYLKERERGREGEREREL